MFRNSLGGESKDQKNIVNYLFPDNASFEINGVAIPLQGIHVDCYGECFDSVTIAHFTSVAARIQPRARNIYNTAIVITDSEIEGLGYPDRWFFERNGFEYLSHTEVEEYRIE